ncbi:MAG: transcription antitermination factor NusB [Waddliaceae bacterium]
MINKATVKSPREAAYFAVLSFLRDEGFAGEWLKLWKEEAIPAQIDYNLAREITFGIIRRKLTLDFLAKELTPKKRLDLKTREKVLLRMAIYQKVFMARIPDHAIVNESVELAKKHCHPSFVNFLNAILRKLVQAPPLLPQGVTVPELSIRFSYPEYFVNLLINTIGLEKTKAILQAENSPPKTMFRLLPSEETIEEKDGTTLIAGTKTPVAILEDATLLNEIASSSNYYIQNITQITLMDKLIEKAPVPSRILDLCAAPGGKLLSLYSAFPTSSLHANDISIEKLKKLEENKTKYQIPVMLYSMSGEKFSTNTPFDLIVIDAPCSNTGVLAKRPEARWRLTAKNLEQLTTLQMQLLRNALTLLNDDGEIWYLTCSILKIENNDLVEEFAKENDLEIRLIETIYPNEDGWEGGFAAALRRK